MASRSTLRRAVPSLQKCFKPTQSLPVRPFVTTLPASAKSPDYAIPDPSRPTHFGYETVTEGEKRERVAEVFTSVAESYDRMNDLMSFGWHRIWK
jgi:2-methoxy-6-polyprenyl-1,4-benzoquinol methylase